MVPVNGSGKPSIPPASPSQRHKGQCTRSVAVHPIRRGAMPTDRVQRPNQQEQTRYRQVNRCHHPSKLHEGRRWVELNREISRRANPLMFGGRRATADPGCGARGRRQGPAGLRDRSLRAEGSRVAISRAGRRPRVHQAATQQGWPLRRPENSRAHSNKHSNRHSNSHNNSHNNKHNNEGASPRPAPPLRPLREEPHHTLTAWRPRS